MERGLDVPSFRLPPSRPPAQMSLLCILACPSLLPSDPFLLAPRAPAAQPWSSTQEARRFSATCSLPRWGAGWVYVGRQRWPALPFPPSHPKAKGQATPPLSLSCFPGQVHPGHSLPGVRVPHSSGFAPHREGWDSCMGGRGGAGLRGERTVPVTLRPRSGAGKGHRSTTAPPEWARKSPSASLGLEEAGVAETVNCSQRT